MGTSMLMPIILLISLTLFGAKENSTVTSNNSVAVVMSRKAKLEPGTPQIEASLLGKVNHGPSWTLHSNVHFVTD
jgi:hypothetical protein